MKKIAILLAIVSITFNSCKKDNASAKVSAENVKKAEARDVKSAEFAEIKFDKVEHDFGKIKEGDVVETTFKFTNVGKGDLVITNAKSSCGCTVPNLTKIKGKVYKTGESGEFSVKFNSRGKPNKSTKTITVSANTKAGTERIKIMAFAKPDPKAAASRKEAAKRRAAARKKKTATPLMLQGK